MSSISFLRDSWYIFFEIMRILENKSSLKLWMFNGFFVFCFCFVCSSLVGIISDLLKIISRLGCWYFIKWRRNTDIRYYFTYFSIGCWQNVFSPFKRFSQILQNSVMFALLHNFYFNKSKNVPSLEPKKETFPNPSHLTFFWQGSFIQDNEKIVN